MCVGGGVGLWCVLGVAARWQITHICVSPCNPIPLQFVLCKARVVTAKPTVGRLQPRASDHRIIQPRLHLALLERLYETAAKLCRTLLWHHALVCFSILGFVSSQTNTHKHKNRLEKHLVSTDLQEAGHFPPHMRLTPVVKLSVSFSPNR